MEFITRILLVLLISFMINCSKSDNPTISIVGNWIAVSLRTECPSSNTTETYACPATATALCYKILFSSNSTYLMQLSGTINGVPKADTYTGVYTMKGNSISTSATNSSGQSFTETDTFSLSGNMLTITSPKNSSTGCTNVIVFTK